MVSEQDGLDCGACKPFITPRLPCVVACRTSCLAPLQADRINYLLTKQAKIVAMTCTHAALKRRWDRGTSLGVE